MKCLRITTAALACFLLGAYPTTAEPLSLSEAGNGTIVLFSSADTPNTQRASESLRNFLETRDITVETVNSAAAIYDSTAASVIAFETAKHAALAERVGLDIGALRDMRAESHMITARRWEGRNLVLVVGATDKGVDAGAAQLLSMIGFWDGKLSIASTMTLREPFLKGREATLAPTGRILTDRPELMKKVNYEHWEARQLENLTRYVRACGFNSLQIMELLAYRGPSDGGKVILTRDRTAPVLQTLARFANDNGLSVSQYIWGSADGFHWSDPATRPQREARYLELAKTYGPHVDHIITHWIDAGDEGGYATPQEATTFLWNAYKKYNPNVLATFDTWGNDSRSNELEPGEGFWAKSEQSGFLDETYSPSEVGVALERWYASDKATLVKKTGRRLGAWGWYLGDYEMDFASHLEARVLDKYFSSLPPDARDNLDWLSIERCFHALPADINWYVAGQKMWDPKRPVGEILLDYCRAVYGTENAEIMREVYQTVEEGQKDYKYYGYFIPESDRFPDVLTTPEYIKCAQRALRKLAGLHLPQDWQPNFPTLAPPKDYIKSLMKSLDALTQGQYPEF